MNALAVVPLVCAVLAFPVSVPAQIGSWNKVDTVTAGECDDLNPSVVHTVFYSTGSNPLRVVFERHTLTESQIAAKRFDRSTATWDSAVEVISSRPPTEEQKYPDYSEVSYYDTSTGLRVMRLAAWQVRKAGRWQLYFSSLNGGSQSWSAPSALVTDSLDNTGVRIRPFADTAFIVTWKRANTVLWLLKSISATTRAETLAVSSSDSIEYDISTKYGVTAILWTSNVQGRMTPLYRQIIRSPRIYLSTPETLQVPVPCYAPHFSISPTPDPTFLFETQTPGIRGVLYFIRYFSSSIGSLDGDSLSDNRNARSFNVPIITKRGSGLQNWFPSDLGLVVYQKYRGKDSSLVFIYGGSGDTARSPGHNWNPVVSSQAFSSARSYFTVLVVWESNRTGRGHIYARVVPLYFASINDIPRNPVAFALMQNYPNPFNPSTTIRYSLAVGTHVTLTVFNTLGQRVATLVSENQEAGLHDVRFDGSKLSSGVYFYRLQAGDFVQSRRLVILK